MKRTASAFFAAAAFGGFAVTASADGTYQTLPYSQDWSNTGMITLNNDWSGVPGWIGYRGDNLTTGVGTDPQTILLDGSNTGVNVTAQGDPSTFAAGGNLEADGIPNPVVAFQGSGTADAPHLVLHLNTLGFANITISYNLRDVDAGVEDANQQVAFQYRVGDTQWINMSAAYVADASSGPGLATLVTPVTVVLPTDANSQSQLRLRWITTNATGADEHVGPDDITVTGTDFTVAVTSKPWALVKALYH